MKHEIDVSKTRNATNSRCPIHSLNFLLMEIKQHLEKANDINAVDDRCERDEEKFVMDSQKLEKSQK